jgi:hypothetical protein
LDRLTTLSDDYDMIVEILQAGYNLGLFNVNDTEFTFLGVLTFDDE